MQIERLVLGPLQTNCWLVSDDAGGPVIVVDPGGDVDELLRTLGDRNVAAVVLTHGHFDHLGAAAELLQLVDAPLYVHAQDAEGITDAVGTGGALFGFTQTAPPADIRFEDGDKIAAGAIELEFLHTPGHTPGSACLLGEGHLFSGDTLFQLGVGRTDFPGGDARTLKDSIAAKLAPLPDETSVHPGHGPETTIGHERRLNPFFKDA
jgi:glyoxylase-like metal-dependent hydrolase (beta-lactamase superfamily II)